MLPEKIKKRSKPDGKKANGTRRRLSGAERKRQITLVAAELFAKRGFRGTTTREIARKAGISEAVIYRHFAKKEDLYKAIIGLRCDDESGKSRLIKSLEGKRGRDVFTGVAEFILGEHEKDPSFMRLLTFSALETRDLAEIFIKTRALELLGFLKSHISELQGEGVYRDVDPEIAARAFIGMVLHYGFSQEIFGLNRYFRHETSSVVDTFVDIFLEGISRGRV